MRRDKGDSQTATPPMCSSIIYFLSIEMRGLFLRNINPMHRIERVVTPGAGRTREKRTLLIGPKSNIFSLPNPISSTSSILTGPFSGKNRLFHSPGCSIRTRGGSGPQEPVTVYVVDDDGSIRRVLSNKGTSHERRQLWNSKARLQK